MLTLELVSQALKKSFEFCLDLAHPLVLNKPKCQTEVAKGGNYINGKIGKMVFPAVSLDSIKLELSKIKNSVFPMGR